MGVAPILPMLGAGMQVVGGIAGAKASRDAAAGEKALADKNAYIGHTRALQTSATASLDLESELSSARAAFAANDERKTSATFDILQGIRDVRERQRVIAVDNEYQRASDYTMQGKNAQARGRAGAIRGYAKAAGSIFDLAQMM